MTSLQSDLTHRQPEHDAIAQDLSAWLDAGNVIEKLGNTPLKHKTEIRFNNRKDAE